MALRVQIKSIPPVDQDAVAVDSIGLSTNSQIPSGRGIRIASTRRSERNPQKIFYPSAELPSERWKPLMADARIMKCKQNDSTSVALLDVGISGSKRKRRTCKRSGKLRRNSSVASSERKRLSRPTKGMLKPVKSHSSACSTAPLMSDLSTITAESSTPLTTTLSSLPPSSPLSFASNSSAVSSLRQASDLTALASRNKQDMIALLQEAKEMHAFDSVAYPSVAKAFEAILKIPRIVTRHGRTIGS